MTNPIYTLIKTTHIDKIGSPLSKGNSGKTINLVNIIHEHYDHEIASELERRLLNSIRGQDNKKFIRGIRKAGDNETD